MNTVEKRRQKLREYQQSYRKRNREALLELRRAANMKKIQLERVRAWLI
jgi:hypothetical protein